VALQILSSYKFFVILETLENYLVLNKNGEKED
jgi:hypothetical protein